jgi:hypothetical protein
MRQISRRLAIAIVLTAPASGVWAQTADDVISRSITAIGGRAALAKLKSRTMTGTITFETPSGNISGSVETWNAVPNKSRSLIKADLTSVGAGPLTIDQRFNGTAGYVLDSLQGNHDLSGDQLDNLRNGSFPHPFLNYKELGTSAQLSGKEKVGERDAYVVIFEPTSGPIVRQYIDAETYFPVKAVVKLEVPQLGRQIELSTEFLDYRQVDGVMIPFRVAASSVVQNYTITIAKVEHNVAIDEALFSKPATRDLAKP